MPMLYSFTRFYAARIVIETLVDCLINAPHTIGFGLCFTDTLRSGQLTSMEEGFTVNYVVLIFFHRSDID